MVLDRKTARKVAQKASLPHSSEFGRRPRNNGCPVAAGSAYSVHVVQARVYTFALAPENLYNARVHVILALLLAVDMEQELFSRAAKQAVC